MLSDVPGTGIMAVYILKKWTKKIIFSPETSELIGRNETKHSTWQQQWFSSSADNEELEENTWGKRRGSLPERRNICEKVHIWSYVCTEEWARWLLWAQLEAFPVMAARSPTLLSLSPTMISVRLLHLENQTAKVAGQSALMKSAVGC